MLNHTVRSRRILFPALLAAAALLGVAGCSGSGNSSSATVTQTSVALSSNVSSVNYGGTVTLTASLGYSSSGAAPIGVITFFDGTNALQATSITGNSTVSTTQTLSAGIHTITASYAGDQTHATSTSSALTITVFVSTTTALTASPTLAASAAPVALTATIGVAAGLPVPTGSVSFYAGGTALGTAAIATVNGTQMATLTTTALTTTGTSSTTYSITASYVASTYFLASTSTPVSVVIHPQLIVTSTVLSLSSPGTIASGTSETLSATVTGVSAGATSPSGTITFYDTNTSVTPNTVNTLGSATVTAGTSTTATASITTKQFNVGSTNSITAVYSGDAVYATSTSAPATLTMSAYSGGTYTNPLTLTDSVNGTGTVYNCPDPAIIKSQTNNVDTWYAYCTGDAFNNSDSVSGTLRAHLISIFSSSDLVHWSYVRDAFATLPTWAASGSELYEPSIKLINGVYTLYFRGNTNSANSAYNGSGEAIGVGTASTPAGPFTYTSAATPLVPSTVACGGGCSATTLAPEVVYDGTNYWLSYGGVYGGLYIQKLNSTGTATTGSATSIAIDNYYTNPYILSYNGYYYLFATPSGSCCNGAYSTYSARVGRSTSITGPYLDAEGNDMNAANPSNGQTQGEPGGDTVLVNTGNTIWGPGSNSIFTDEAGQTYALYSAISANRQCLTSGGTYLGGSCYAARQLMMDPIDWVNGWPVVRGGTGDSDQPQPVPASQPSATNGYVTPVYTADAPGTLQTGYSQDFTGATSFSSEFSFIHEQPNTICQSDGSGAGSTFPYGPLTANTPGFSSSGYTLCSNFAASDSSYPGDTMAQLPILAETEPAGNYLIEVKFHSLVPPTACCTANYSSQGLLVYSSDTTYLRLDEFADFDTRQIEFLNQLTANISSGSFTTFYAPVGTPNGANYTYLRLAKRITNTTTGAATYTSYSSVDGVHYVRGPSWNVSYGTSGTKVGIFAGNTGFGAVFSYIHVSTLTP